MDEEKKLIRVMTSLPRSGTHWVKAMISELLGEPPLEERLIDPDVLIRALSTDAPRQLRYDHFEYDAHGSILTADRYPGLRMILLYRNPLDVLISMYYRSASERSLHDNSLDAMSNLRLFLQTHRRNKPLPACFEKHPKYEQLKKHDYLRCYLRNAVMDWWERGQCLPLRYEDLVGDPETHLRRIADYLEIEYTTTMVADAVQQCRFEKLSGGRKPGEIDVHSHYRQGIPGEWRSVYTGEDLEIINEQIGNDLHQLGYQIV
jgi:hypothetical protein